MKHITVHVLTTCPHCQRVLQYLSHNQIEHTVVEYDNKRGELAQLKQDTGHPTVPQVFFGSELIGGADDFFTVVESGNLEQRLA